MAREKGKGRARLQERRAYAQLVERSVVVPPPMTREERKAGTTTIQLAEAYLPGHVERKRK